jgi:membrane-associated phospholipid phosphatase
MTRAGIAMIGWLAVSWLTGTTGYAAARPQDQEEQQKRDASAKSERSAKEEKPKADAETNGQDPDDSRTLPLGVRGLGGRFLLDQKQVWTSPTQLRWSDTNWLMPLSGLTAGLFVTDADMSRHISRNPTTVSHYNTLSNAAVAGLLGGAGAMWVLSYPKHDQHWRETGFLAGEAVINSLVVVEAMKYPLGRQRPFEGNGNGEFFQRGTSFPSEHAAAAWAAAGVVAHEYPGTLTKIVVYSLASLVDYSRYRAHQHFPSDIFIGDVIGNMVAQSVYSGHHDPELGGTAWKSASQFVRGDGTFTPANMGSPYVPLDSWVYPAFDRLVALGYVRTAMLGMRPWTRLECARILKEAEDRIDTIDFDAAKANGLYDSLTREFSKDLALLNGGENASMQVESIYSRVTGISGEPLTDGFHFGQTILNDFGRPYGEGFNTVNGFSGWASEGRLTAYLRGEYQHTPLIPALPAQARQWIATSYGTLPVPPAVDTPAVNQFQLLDAYVAFNLENWQFSIGKQSLWLGASLGGPMLFSDNSVPVNMFRIDRVTPFKFPWILGFLGPTRWQFIFGRLSGQDFVRGDRTGLIGVWNHSLDDQPFIVGQKLSFKPTPNFEFGIGYTRLTAGNGQPFTTHQFLLATFSVGNGHPGGGSDPGDIRSAVDFSYRVPGLRNWLSLYGDAFTEDEFSPIGYPRKSAYQGGIYMPRIPGIPKLDFRLEGGSTEPADFGTCVGCFYTNTRFLSGYTNQGYLMGSWLGRSGQGEQAWSTYWLSSHNKIQVHCRHQKAVGNFVEGGGTVNDAGVNAEIWLNARTEFSGAVQYEKWNYPLLAPNAKTNITTSVGLTFWPGHWATPIH